MAHSVPLNFKMLERYWNPIRLPSHQDHDTVSSAEDRMSDTTGTSFPNIYIIFTPNSPSSIAHD